MSQKSSFDKTLNLVLGDKTHSGFNFLKTEAGNGVPGAVWESFQSSHDQASEYNIVQPAQAPAETVFASSNSYTEFLFNPNKSRLVQVLLDLNVKSPTNPPLYPATVYRLFDRFEYYSGSTLLASYDANSLWAFHGLTRSPAEHTQYREAENQTESYQGWFDLTDYRKFSLDITGPLASLVTGFVREQIRIRVYYNNEVNWSLMVAGPGAWSPYPGQLLKSIRLIVETTPLPSDEAGVVQSVYNSGKFMHRFIEPRVVRHALAINNNSTYTISLSGLHGAHSGIFVACRRADDNINLYSNVFSKVWLTDSNGAILQGGTPFECSTLNTISAGSFAGPFLHNGVAGNWAPLIFSKSINSDIASGTVGGSVILRSQGESLHFSTVEMGLISALNVEILIIGCHFSAYRVVDGSLVSLR